MGSAKDFPQYPHPIARRKALGMGNHIFQRAFLLTIVAVLGTYTVLEYFYTRNVLSQCLEVTTYGTTIAASSSVALSQVEPTSVPEAPLADQHLDQMTLKDTEDLPEKAPAKVKKSPEISKVTMMYGPHAEDETMKLIIEGHKQHAERHGHGIHILDRQLLHGLWSKHAWMLMIMLEEMQKPEDLRTKWLAWFDTDIIIMNPNIPLNIFLPPKDFSHLNLLCTNDHNGLNNGAFMIRVGEWGVRYFVDSLALRTYQPDLKLKYSEQSAMEVTLGVPKYANKTMHVPQRWFNAYRGPRNADGRLIRGQKVPDNTIMPGDLQLHFAGKKTTKALMPQWVALASNETGNWNVPLSETKLETEIALFWKLEKEKKDWDEPVKKLSKGESELTQSKKAAQAIEHGTGDVEQSAVEHGTDDMEQGTDGVEQQDSES